MLTQAIGGLGKLAHHNQGGKEETLEVRPLAEAFIEKYTKEELRTNLRNIVPPGESGRLGDSEFEIDLEIFEKLAWLQERHPARLRAMKLLSGNDNDFASKESLARELAIGGSELADGQFPDIDDALARHNPQLALRLLEHHFQQKAESLEAKMLKGRALAMLGRDQELEKLVEEVRGLKVSDAREFACILEVQRALLNGQTEKAESLLSGLFVRHSRQSLPTQVLERARRLQMVTLFTLARTERLAIQWDGLADESWDNAWLRVHIGLRLGWLDRVDQALSILSTSPPRDSISRSYRRRRRFEACTRVRRAWDVLESTAQPGPYRQRISLKKQATRSEILSVLSGLEETLDELSEKCFRDDRLLVLETALMMRKLFGHTEEIVRISEAILEIHNGHPEAVAEVAYHALQTGRVRRADTVVNNVEGGRFSSAIRHISLLVDLAKCDETESDDVLDEYFSRLQHVDFLEDPIFWDYYDEALLKIRGRTLDSAHFDVSSSASSSVTHAAVRISHLLRADQTDVAIRFAEDWLSGERDESSTLLVFARVFANGRHWGKGAEYYERWRIAQEWVPGSLLCEWAKSVWLSGRRQLVLTALTVRARVDSNESERSEVLQLLIQCERELELWESCLGHISELLRMDEWWSVELGLLKLHCLLRLGRLSEFGASLKEARELLDTIQTGDRELGLEDRRNLAHFDRIAGNEVQGLEQLYQLTWEECDESIGTRIAGDYVRAVLELAQSNRPSGAGLEPEGSVLCCADDAGEHQE